MKKISNSLTDRFDDPMKLMAVLCECYDQGNDIVALSIATAIRVLIHDTEKAPGSSNLGHLAADWISPFYFVASGCSEKNAHICRVASMLRLYDPTMNSALTRPPPGH